MPQRLRTAEGQNTPPPPPQQPEKQGPLGLPSSQGLGGSFAQRRDDIWRRLQRSAAECRRHYGPPPAAGNRRELATEKDENVAELCAALEDAFSYGLRQRQAGTISVAAANLFQNMHEIMTGAAAPTFGDVTFWDFCQSHLTADEVERYTKLQHIRTKQGRGRAFIRATLNEASLERYLLIWLEDAEAEETLQRFYAPWSLLLAPETRRELPPLAASLGGILFALSVDAAALNEGTREAPTEPIIFAPAPSVVGGRPKRRANAVERPIAGATSTENLLSSLQSPTLLPPLLPTSSPLDAAELLAQVREMYVTAPLEADPVSCAATASDFSDDEEVPLEVAGADEGAVTIVEDQEDTSSMYSKSSSSLANGSPHLPDLERDLLDANERCRVLQSCVDELRRENRQLKRRLTQLFHETGIDPTASLAANFLITIPHVRRHKSRSGGSYHAYEIHITMRYRHEHWAVTRRYRDFNKLQQSLLRTHPSALAAVDFPPKKSFGNMNEAFVEARRQQLQDYLLNVMEALPAVAAAKSKADLQRAFPFLRDIRPP